MNANDYKYRKLIYNLIIAGWNKEKMKEYHNEDFYALVNATVIFLKL